MSAPAGVLITTAAAELLQRLQDRRDRGLCLKVQEGAGQLQAGVEPGCLRVGHGFPPTAAGRPRVVIVMDCLQIGWRSAAIAS